MHKKAEQHKVSLAGQWLRTHLLVQHVTFVSNQNLPGKEGSFNVLKCPICRFASTQITGNQESSQGVETKKHLVDIISRMLLNLANPITDVVERLLVCHIVYEQDTHRAAVICRGNGPVAIFLLRTNAAAYFDGKGA